LDFSREEAALTASSAAGTHYLQAEASSWMAKSFFSDSAKSLLAKLLSPDRGKIMDELGLKSVALPQRDYDEIGLSGHGFAIFRIFRATHP
jgi:hypothetical protein